MSVSLEPRQIRKFNPGTLQSDEEVMAQFVVRDREFAAVFDVLRGNIDSPSCQHVLLVAPRGRGKTMLLARVAAELRTNDEFSQRLLPVRFMEESQEIFNVGDFWLEALFYLAREQALHHPERAQELKDVHDALASQWRGSEVEERARAAVLQAADRLGVKLVLMVENMQALCSDVDEDFGWKLRSVLQSEPKIILLATATSRFKGLDDAREPFFELFRTLRLDPLDTEECRLLWQMVSGDTVSRREIRPLQILTGGSPRLLVIVAEFARHRSLVQLMEELVRLIDDHTEYFRSHLERFSRTERRVYLAVIDLWQPSRTGEIAERARMDVRSVSTLLGRLVQRGAVIVEGNGKRQRMYVAAERLYSIYYKLRRERDEAAVIRNLIHFMAVFYAEAEMAELAGRLRSEAEKSPIIRRGIERAIADSPQIGPIFFHDERQIEQASEHAAATTDLETKLTIREIMFATMNAENARVDDPHAEVATYDELVERFGNSDVPEVQTRIAMGLVNKGVTLGRIDDPHAEIATYDALVERFGNSDVPEVQIRIAMALVNKGVTLGRIDDPHAEIATYDALVERFGNSDVPEIQAQMAMALLYKGITLGRIDDPRAGIATYDELVERFGNSDVPEVQIRIAKALVNKGVTLGRIDDPHAEIATYDALVERFGNSDVPEIQAQMAMALLYKGITLGRINDPRAGIATYDELVERFGNSDVPEVQIRIAKALVNKGVTLGRIDDPHAEIATYDALLERFGNSDVPEIQAQMAMALLYKGVTLGRIDDPHAEIATYDALVERFGNSGRPEIQAQMAMALLYKGITLGQINDPRAGIATYDELVERFGNSDVPEVQIRIAKALVNKGVTLGRIDDPHAEIATYDALVERFGNSDVPEIQAQMAMALLYKGITLGQINDPRAGIATYDELVERFGNSDVPEVQIRIAMALVNKGVTLGRIDDPHAEIATYDALLERFGNSDVPEIQAQMAMALLYKGITLGQIDDPRAGIATCDELVERFGNSDVPEIQLQVARSLANKAEGEIRLGQAEEALCVCDELERRVRALSDNEKATFGRRVGWLRMEALLLLSMHSAAMDEFRAVYTLFHADEGTMVREMLAQVPKLIAAGAPEGDLVEILSSDRKKSDALLPLVVALRQRTGETVRAPAEVQDVATDIRERISEQE